MFILQNSNWITQGENSQIPRFGKICDKLALFRKYLAIYYFFSTRVPQNRVLHSTRASYSRVPCFSFFLFFPTVHAIEFFSISLSHVEALFLLLFYYLLFINLFLISRRNSILQVKETCQVKENGKHLCPRKRSMNLVCMSGVVLGHLL